MGIVSDEIKALKPTCFGAAEVRNIGGRFYVYPFTSKYDKITKKRHKVTLRCVGKITLKDGFIPKYYVDGPQDKVDRVIEDMQYYVKTLVTEEMGLGNLIENAVKKIEQRQANEVQESADGDDIDMDEENKLFDYNNNIITTDEDFQEFYDWEDDEEKANEDFLKSFFKEEGQK